MYKFETIVKETLMKQLKKQARNKIYLIEKQTKNYTEKYCTDKRVKITDKHSLIILEREPQVIIREVKAQQHYPNFDKDVLVISNLIFDGEKVEIVPKVIRYDYYIHGTKNFVKIRYGEGENYQETKENGAYVKLEGDELEPIIKRFHIKHTIDEINYHTLDELKKILDGGM